MSANDDTLRVTFVDGNEEVTGATDRVRLTLDEDANLEVTTFTIGAHAFVRQFPPGNATYYISAGTLKKSGEKIPITITDEYVRFALAKEGTLNYEPEGTVTYEWYGDSDNERPAYFNGRKVTTSEDVVGILKCSYVTLFDQLEVTYNGPNPADVLVVAVMGDAKDSLAIPFTEGAGTREVIITVKDYCNGEIVPYAEITLSADGYPSTIFNADINGDANLGELEIGKHYDIKITATGYTDSDLDALSNDGFTVSEES